MFKHGRVALVAIACVAAPLAAHAQDHFFIGAQAGQARFNVEGVDHDNAATQNLSLGYRWQAGPIAQVGIEVGAGQIGEVGSAGYDGYGNQRVQVKTRYTTIGVNARFQFERDSRWFAETRLGAMNYRQGNRESYFYMGYYSGVSAQQTTHTSDTGAYAGAGIGVDIPPNFNITVMFNGYAFPSSPYVDGSYAASTVTAGLELRF